MKNVVLIGMPGCGKSTVGVVLAKLMGMDFMDVDLVIQRKYHKRLQSLIDQYGNQGFLDLEADTISWLDCEETVIATGGSAALHHVGVRAMKKLGPVVYLQHPCQEIIQRIHNLDSRGITLEKGQTLEDLYNYRTPIYESVADITVNAAGLTVEQTARRVEEALVEWEKGRE
jgi:shikimate kinase